MSAAIRDYYNSFLNTLSGDWSSKGFRTRPRDKFTRTLGGVQQRLAVSLREPPDENTGYIEIYVGFNFPELEALAAGLKGEKPRSGFITCSLNLGFLTSKRELLEWPLGRKEDVQRILREVQHILAEVAIPFWDEFLSVEDLLAHYEAGDSRVCSDDWVWNQMAAYCLLSKPERALRLLEETQATESWPKSTVEKARWEISKYAQENLQIRSEGAKRT